MGRIQIPVSLGGANHLLITLICPPATDNKILLSTLINISPALITRNPRSRKKENKCLARYQTYVTTRIEEFRGKRKKGSAVFRVDLLYEEGSRKRPPTWRRKKFLGMQRYIPPDPFAFESRMRGVFIEGHVSLQQVSPSHRHWGDLTTASIVFLFFPRHVPRVSVCRASPFHTGMDTVSTDEKSWWPRFRDTPISSYIYIYV